MSKGGIHKARTSSVELPSAHELRDILTKESARKAVYFDYLSNNRDVFDTHRQLAQLAGANDGWTVAYPTIPLEQLTRLISDTHVQISQYIQKNNSDYLLYEKLYEALVPKQDETTSDAIFVFGSQSDARIMRAIELYKDGIAPKIIVSGKGPHYKEIHDTEAGRMAKVAQENGVPIESLVIEDKSITIPDNVKRTLDFFESTSWRPSSLTIIATDFVLRRAEMDWYKFSPWPIDIKPVAARSQSQKFTKDNWYKHSDSIGLVLNEYAKLILESKIDLLRLDE